jgi:transposase
VRKPAVRLPVEEKQRVVLAVLAGELTAAEAARRHGVSTNAVLSWRAKFLDAGKRALEEKISGPDRGTCTPEERRLRVEANQLKLALAEATVQLRIWEKGAGYVHHVPSPTSKP